MGAARDTGRLSGGQGEQGGATRESPSIARVQGPRSALLAQGFYSLTEKAGLKGTMRNNLGVYGPLERGLYYW